jgi:imidazolonepropionase
MAHGGFVAHLDASTVVIENIRKIATLATPDVLEGDLALGVRKGRVRYLGPRALLPQEFTNAARFDAGRRLLTPALIDCHTHPAFVCARAGEWELKLAGVSYEEIAARGGGILSSAHAVAAADNATLSRATQRNLLLLKAHGVGVVEAKSGYGLCLEHELRQLRAIAHAGDAAEIKTVGTCLAAHTLPENRRGSPELREQYLREVCEEILPQAARSALATRADVFCERGVFTSEETRRIGRAAKSCRLALTVHADQLSHSGGTRVACELGAQSADHLEYVDDADIAAMKAAGVVAVLLPGSTFFLRQNQWAPARRLIEAGVPVALATDFNPGSSPICNPAFIMHLAVRYLGMTPRECLAGFTRHAARALGLSTEEWGIITPGSRAAFAIWDVEDAGELPYYTGSNLCAGVITCQGWRD